MSKNKKIKKEEIIPESSIFDYKSSSTLDKIIYFGAVVVVVLHLIGIFIQSPFTWGFNYISFLNPIIQLIFILFAIFVFLPIGQKSIYSFIQNLIKLKSKLPGYLVYLLVIVICGLIFWILRVKVYVLGDASLMFQSVNIDDTEIWTNREMLTTRVVAFFNELFKGTGPTSVINSYILISFLSGIIFIIATIEISRLLGRNDIEKFLIFLFLMLSASSLLFFGYVENYPILYAFMSLYFLFAIRCLLKKSSIFYALVFYSIIFLLHMSTLILFPTIFYLFYREFKQKKRVLIILLYILIVVFILAVLLYISGKGFTKLVNIFSGGWSLISGNAVPLSLKETDFAAYSMFSIKHLIDFINHQLLINPLVLFFIILFIVYQFKKLNWRDPIFLFLSFATISTLGLGFTFNHIYGMSKDWDVVAPFIITLLLLCIYLMINKFNIIKNKKWIISIILGVLFFHTVSYILVYSGEESAISRSKALQDERIMPKIGIIVTDMNIAEYYHMKEEFLKVARTYQSLMERYPYDSRGYILLTKTYDLDLKNIDKAIEITLLAEKRGVYNKKIEYNLGHYYYRKNLYDLAISKWKIAIAIDSSYIRAYNYLSMVYAMQNKYDSAIIFLNKSLILNPNDATVYQNLGNCYLAKGNYSSAIPWLERYSLTNSSDYTNYKNLGICYKEIGDVNRTIGIWSKYLEIAPRSNEYELISTEIKKLTNK